MAVTSATSSISYTGNNSTTTSYAVPFVFLENSHLAATAKVTATGVESAVTLTSHTGAGDVNGGTVSTAVAVPATSTLTIFRTVPATQTTTYQEGGDFPAASHERALDKLTFIAQQNQRIAEQSIRVTEADGARNEFVAAANTMIGLDANKQPKALTVSEIKSLLAISGTTLSVPAGIKTFADAGERALAVPEFTGQLGTQRDTADIYISTGTAAGSWADFSLSLSNIPNASITSAKLAHDGGPMGGFRNRIINGNFDIWQRGTSFTAQGYTSDRWQLFITGTTCTLSRQSFTLGQTDVPFEPTYFNRAVVTSSAGASNLCLVAQRIEDVRTLAGQSATVSFYAKADAAKPIALELTQHFGSGGSPSATVATIGSQKFNLTTSWQKFTATISIPSISGKTLGSDNNSRLQINLWLDAGSGLNANTDTLGQQSGTFDIAQVQVERGSVATPFEARPIGTELSLCQRYYSKSFNLETAPASNAGTAGSNSTIALGAGVYTQFSITLPAPMRANPTINVHNTNATGSEARNTDTNANCTLTNVDSVGESRFRVATLTPAGSSAGNRIAIHWQAVAEL